jgi:choline dehydrogenase
VSASAADGDWDFIVVGAGAGGGTVAARLAEEGARVLLLEAGGDPREMQEARLPDDYDVPAFHAFASENPGISWDFHVDHYDDPEQAARDPKRGEAGVLYPRAAALGGCTAHNALIFMVPPDCDWDNLAAATGDPSWSAKSMRRYRKLVENCRHRPDWRLLSRIGLDPTGHGWDGWLSVEHAAPEQAFGDGQLVGLLLKSARALLRHDADPGARLKRFLLTRGDPNDARARGGAAEGLCYTPLSTRGFARVGARERLVDVARRHPDRLRIETNALATSVVLDRSARATGVRYLEGERLYRAHRQPSAASGELREAHARRGVIVAGGAFNTPQLLMLSGIGDPHELERHGIECRIGLPGVGRNLQDRYEVSVVNRMASDWQVLEGARFERGDPLWQAWRDHRAGMYISNGAALGVAKRSRPELETPDLFCMAFLAKFAGYSAGYSREIAASARHLSWAILKSHTANRAGQVALRSADPRDPPRISFRYFEEGSDTAGDDLAAVVHGIRFVRTLTEPLRARGLIEAEEAPGFHIEDEEELKAYARDTAWGHHASSSCAIGGREDGGVLTSDFRVHGTQGLWVVDASIFPRIPGFFIASAVYLIAEKAAEVIFRDRSVA